MTGDGQWIFIDHPGGRAGVIGTTDQWQCSNGESGSDNFITAVIYGDENGTNHSFPLSGTPPDYSAPGLSGCPYQGMVNLTAYSSDSAGYLVTMDNVGDVASVLDKHGRNVTFGSNGSFGIEDENGNKITETVGGSPNSQVYTITDTVNRTITRTQNTLYPPLRTSNQVISYLDQNGNPQTITVTYIPVQIDYPSICTAFGVSTAACEGAPDATPPATVDTTYLPGTVTLQNGDTYTITYDSNNHGDIGSITLPTGAVISYTYGDFDYNGWRVISRTVTANGVSSIWKYGYTLPTFQTGGYVTAPSGSFYTTTATDPNNNDTVYTCTYYSAGTSGYYLGVGVPPCNMTQEQIYSGSSSTGTLLATKATGYSYSTAVVMPTSETFTWAATNQKMERDTQWDSENPYPGLTGPTSGYISFGNKISDIVYDYGTGSHGPLLSNTQYAYLYAQNSSYLNANMLDRVSSVSVYNSATLSSSSLIAQATTAFDGFNQTAINGQGSITGTTGTTQHDYTNYSSTNTLRGLPTSSTAYIGPTTTSVTSYVNYNDLGKPTIVTDGRGYSTQFKYGAQNAFVAKTTLPSAGGVQQVTTTSYDLNTGLLISQKDPNGQTTGKQTTYTYDNRMRPLTVTAPDGGSTTYSYPDPNHVSTSVQQNASTSSTTEVTLDELGRTISSSLSADATCGAITVDTTYDLLGRVSSVSNPHCNSSNSATDGIKTYTYDAIGRVTQTLAPDQTTQGWSYNGSSVTFTDENLNQWKRTSDALGRLTSVLEPNGASRAPSLETDYGYDALNDLTTVKQCGGACSPSSSPTRTFAYDGLSRLLCASNPENSSASCPTVWTGYTSGTTGYTYDANGNLHTKVFPALNGAVGTETLGYCYDPLNRMVGKWSQAQPIGCNSTPTSVTASLLATYTYDSSSISGATNTVGRLTDEKAYVGGTLVAENSPYQYDPVGRSLANQEVPYAPLGTPYQFLYSYDLTGNTTCANNGIASVTSSSTCASYGALSNSITTTYSYDAAARLNTVTAGTPCSGTCSPFPTTTLYAATSYGPAGIVTANYGNGLSLSRFYDNRMRVMDHEIFPSTDTFGWAKLTIAGSEQPGDSGQVSLTAGGVTMSTPYGANSTPQSIAQALVNVINQNQQSPVSASWNSNSPNVVQLTALEAGTSGPTGSSSVSAIATDAGTSSPSFTATIKGTVLQGASGTTAYYYKLDYDGVGNVIQTEDELNAWWQYGYDSLNRLISGISNGATYPFVCWSYDGFGNRYFELDMTFANHVACPASNAPAGSGFTPPSNSQYLWATYNSSNRVTSTAVNSAVGGFSYDLSGNVLNDGANQYVYDAEGRICAVKTFGPAYTQYVYDAEGRRVAKGSISQLPAAGSVCSAPTAANGFSLTRQYLRGAAGNQDTELDGSGNWVHTNIFSGDGLTATYWNNGGTNTLSYNFNDWLGTKRMQATSASPSMLESYSQSYPYGNYFGVSGNGGDATEHHFTGKERDNESGLDYFGARYYASSMGRFMSPDPSQLTYADQTNPQSFNLYSYVRNNPLINTDPSGMECVWDDGSYDDQHDPDTGNDVDSNGKDVSGSGYSKCSAAGGTWVDHSFFQNANNNGANLPDWSPDANSSTAANAPLGLVNLVTGCTDTIITALNTATKGQGFTSADVTDNFYWGGAVNIDVTANNLSATQYGAVQQTRYASPGFFGGLLGIGPSVHLPAGPGNGSPSQDSPSTLPFSKQNGTVTTSVHIDSAQSNAAHPIGAAIHGSVDVAGAATRNPCP